jgi:hypothetical protein
MAEGTEGQIFNPDNWRYEGIIKIVSVLRKDIMKKHQSLDSPGTSDL